MSEMVAACDELLQAIAGMRAALDRCIGSELERLQSVCGDPEEEGPSAGGARAGDPRTFGPYQHATASPGESHWSRQDPRSLRPAVPPDQGSDATPPPVHDPRPGPDPSSDAEQRLDALARRLEGHLRQAGQRASRPPFGPETGGATSGPSDGTAST